MLRPCRQLLPSSAGIGSEVLRPTTITDKARYCCCEFPVYDKFKRVINTVESRLLKKLGIPSHNKRVQATPAAALNANKVFTTAVFFCSSFTQV